jgi:hypothetical protein
MKRSELKELIKEVIEESKESKQEVGLSGNTTVKKEGSNFVIEQNRGEEGGADRVVLGKSMIKKLIEFTGE